MSTREPRRRGRANERAEKAGESRRYSDRARSLMNSTLVVDMLGMMAMTQRDAFQWMFDREGMSSSVEGDFRLSRIDVFHQSLPFHGADAYPTVLSYLAAWTGFCARYPDTFVRVTSATQFETLRASDRIGVVLGVQNSDHFRCAADVDLFHKLGQRVSQLTYNSQNLIGSGSTERHDGGLSDFGVQIVEAMDAVGMLVDVSHCNARTTRDAIEAAKGPVAVTHSNCRALNDHPRLKDDETIRRLAAKGGVFGVSGIRSFVSSKEPTDLDDMVSHIDHIARLVGVEHVGIGSDVGLNGYDDVPEEELAAFRAGFKEGYLRDRVDIDGFNHPQKFFDLTERLIARGYSDSDIRGVLGGNFARLMAEVWR